MAQFFDDKDSSAFAHDEAVPRRIERSRGLSRRLIESGRNGAGGSKSTEADNVYACFCSAADGDVRFIGADKTGRIADRLDAGRTCRHGCAQRPFEAVANGDVTCREVHQEGGHRERGKASNPALINRSHRFRYGGESADAGSDDRACAHASRFRSGLPVCLRNRLVCRGQCEENEPINLALILGRKDGVRIEARVGVFFQRRHHTADLRGQVLHHIVRKSADARAAGQET